MVCTGNICRSPTAEGVVRQRLVEAGLDGTIAVASAGTHGYHVGAGADARAIATAAARGYDLSGHKAQRVTLDNFESYDLILAMDSGHLQALERMRPGGVAERMRGGGVVERMRGGGAAIVRLFLDDVPDLKGADVPDPYYGGQADFEHALDLVERGADGLIAVLLTAPE